MVRLERELFIGFYSIRKLMDTFKVSDSTKAFKFDLTYHRCVRQVDYLDTHDIEKSYDFEQSTPVRQDITFVCNQFIHSYIFCPVTAESGKFSGVFVASDRERNTRLFYIAAQQIIASFRLVGSDYPSHLRLTRNDQTGQLSGTAR